MMGISKVIDEAVSFIHSNEQSKKGIAEKLLPLKGKKISFPSKELLEELLVFPVHGKPLEGKIAGVDSGFVDKKLASVDLVLIRAVGVLFEYEKGFFRKSSYVPGLYSFPMPHLSNHALELDEFACSKSLLRLREEVSTAREVIEKFSPEYCFLDGSIVRQYQDKPRKDSVINELYHSIVREFEDLFETAEKNKCILVGCVEDSRGSRFRSVLQEEVLQHEKLLPSEKLDYLFDSALLDYLLSVGERTCALHYTKNISQHPILNDFDEKWSKNIFSFYLKPSLYDRPLRVEFINGAGNLTEKSSKIASVVFSLSSLHREYAFPSVLIEADLRARLRPEEIDVVVNKIMDKVAKNVKMKLRRDSRPF